MAQPSTQHQFASVKTETDVAVLQVQYQNLTTKVDELKTDLKGLGVSMEKQSEATMNAIDAFQEDNQKAHKEVSDKISSLEKWRWTIMGAGMAAGALGWPLIQKILGL